MSPLVTNTSKILRKETLNGVSALELTFTNSQYHSVLMQNDQN